MARKTKEDAQLTCVALLEAAGKVFFQNGVAGTTLNDIAACAGLTRGAIYWHFRDKTDLLKALFERNMLPAEAMLQELEQAKDVNPLQALRDMCVQLLTNLARSPEQQRVFSIMLHKCEYVGQVAAILEVKTAKREECLVKINAILQRAVTGGYLPPNSDIALIYQSIISFMSGIISEWLLAPRAFALDTSAPAMIDMLFSGFQACPPRRALAA